MKRIFFRGDIADVPAKKEPLMMPGANLLVSVCGSYLAFPPADVSSSDVSHLKYQIDHPGMCLYLLLKISFTVSKCPLLI